VAALAVTALEAAAAIVAAEPGRLHRDDLGAAALGGARLAWLLEQAGVTTPAYVYDVGGVVAEAREIRAAFGATHHLIAYAVKANSAGPIVRALADEGVGADVVSGAELELVAALGVRPEDIVFSGVAKRDDEIDRALLLADTGILALQVESVEEIPRIDARARAVGRRARVSLRVNPGIEADTHAYIATGHDEAKFGVPRGEIGAAVEALLQASEVELVGVGNHVGSQLTVLDDYIAAARMLVPVFGACETAMTQAGRPALRLIDFGGGFGIDYGGGCPVRPADFVGALVQEVARAGLSNVRAVVEPGRSLVGGHGVLCSAVIMQKRASLGGADRRWLMIDAGMNDLLRPALYQAFHRIEAIEGVSWRERAAYRVVGPVCESSDDFGTHELPDPPPAHVVIRDAGAYGFTMASEYNGRALPAEIFVRGGEIVAVIRPRSAQAWVRARMGE